jgi:hypothetical protein
VATVSGGTILNRQTGRILQSRFTGPVGSCKTSTERNYELEKFFFAFIAAWIFVFAFGFVWYGNLMHSIHDEVSVLWRTEAEFGGHFPWLVLGHAVMAFFLTLLYASFVASGGAGAGAKLGVMIAFLYIGNNLITFAVQPLTTKILAGWMVGGLLEFAIAGAIVGAIYKPAQAQTMP